MDPMAASLADEGTALFLDARSLAFERVPLPTGADLVVLNSGVAHDHAAGDYNTRRAECERACSLLGVKLLRDLGPADLSRVEALPEPLRRRARHVVTENERVLRAVEAMRRGDLMRSIFGGRVVMLIPEMTVLLLVAHFVFGVPIYGNFFLLALTILVGSFAFAGIGLLLASRTAKLETISGLMNLVMMPGWLLSGSFFSAKRFPEAAQPVIQALPLTQLNDALRAAVADPKARQSFAEGGMEPYSPEELTPAAAAELLRREIKLWGDVIRANHIAAQ